jgi:hypothetical protein
MNIANTNTCRKTYLGKSINNSVRDSVRDSVSDSIYYSVRNSAWGSVDNLTNIRL